MSCLLIWFESWQKVAVNGELTVLFWRSPVFGRKSRLKFGEDLFFLEIACFGPEKPFEFW